MEVIGIIALIGLVIAGVMVLRVKSDPLENDSIRKALADSRSSTDVSSRDASGAADLSHPGSSGQDGPSGQEQR